VTREEDGGAVMSRESKSMTGFEEIVIG